MNWKFRVGVVLVLFAAALYYKTVFDPGLGTPLDDQSVFQEMIQEPTVLVYTTHATENYAPAALFATKADGDIVTVAGELTNTLEFAGVSAMHDTTLNDVPVFKDAYVNSRTTVNQILQSNPTIQVLLDIHRSISDHPKTLKKDETTCYTAGDTPAAKMQFIVGKAHPGWEKNLAFAEKLRTKLEAVAPGLCLPIAMEEDARLNEDLSAEALVVSIGEYQMSTISEAKHTARLLADAVKQVLNESTVNKDANPKPGTDNTTGESKPTDATAPVGAGTP